MKEREERDGPRKSRWLVRGKADFRFVRFGFGKERERERERERML